ncbi:hypothetical protein GYMLUDRAFT_74717 [Collybiopsis luxurians FD-317 M1]|uniref:5-formyltetrahydrofolate cyclo-ligase n=1 Tax=Collybiopsis luxurians FD-317 M1 TaxID=944289 RepID=A0A0D0C8T8_9AGAR|nr:hypothetical protein GYMLUDRAFT_74717 [Collybiopsis luxurians FD-317 M1]
MLSTIQTCTIAAKVSLLPVFQDYNSLSCFLSMPSGEVDMSGIVADILASANISLSGNKSLLIPKMSQNGSMEFLKVHKQVDLDMRAPYQVVYEAQEPSNEWKGKPHPNGIDVVLDLTLVPGVAFDRLMSYLGFGLGKGYYDRYITRYIAMALASHEQLLDSSISTSEHDCKMDVIVMLDEVVMVW